MSYINFIKSKEKNIQKAGFSPKKINSNLFPFQKHIVTKACEMGRYAIFADCGLGKTIMQLEWANQVSRQTKKPVLILAPLAVSSQTIQEGLKFGIDVKPASMIDGMSQNAIYISNYEQLDNIDCNAFLGVVLDESSILKNFEGKIKTKILESFSNTPYKLACTATPSPNDVMELGNHAEFLNVMKRSEMLAMYFVHDGGMTSKWRLKKHAQSDFWAFVSSWSMMLCKPSDIGFKDKGYNLPSLNYIEKQIKTEKKNNGRLFNDTNVSATDFNKELKFTIVQRLDEVAQIVNNSDENFIIWIKQNEEGQKLRELIPDAVEVKGNDKPKLKENRLLGFANNDFRVLITKTKIAQFGLNYQNCNNQVFASLDFSFEGLYQAIRRSYRFGQEKEVNIYLITTDTMVNVLESIKQKQKQFETMQQAMQENYCQFRETVNNTTHKAIKGQNYTLYHGDCVNEIQKIEDKSVGFSIFSPPFAELYTFSDSPHDMGNAKNYDEFEKHFSYLIPELFRIMQDGRNVAIHCMDLPIQKGKEGYIGLRDFSGMILKMFQDNGFIYHSRVTIWKDPVVEMQRTKALGLLHKQVKKDSTMSRVGIPDYLMIFRKKGDNKNPVTNTDLPVDLWQKYASPVWMDIDYGNTLQYTTARDRKDEKHISVLQLETIERSIHLWTNKGDTVFTPFMGIGSEVYQSLKMDRKAIGIELKDSYFNIAKQNAKTAQDKKSQLKLF